MRSFHAMVLALAVGGSCWSAPPNKPKGPSSPFQQSFSGNSANAATVPTDAVKPPQEVSHDGSAGVGGAGSGPFRWVCVGKLNDRPTVTAETTGPINSSCDTVTKQTLKDLAVAKAGNTSVNAGALPPVRADQATVYCRKEEFLLSCQ